MQLSDLYQFKSGDVPADYPTNVLRLYSPFDDVHGAFKAMLSGAGQSIYVSMYGEDDSELTDILLQKAEDPNIFVQINLDKTQAAGQAESALVAKLKACPSTRLVVGSSINHKINHLKMVRQPLKSRRRLLVC